MICTAGGAASCKRRRSRQEARNEQRETKHSQFTAEAIVFTKGQTLRATESTSDMRASIDRLVDNLERQVVGYREKRRLERRRRTEHHGV